MTPEQKLRNNSDNLAKKVNNHIAEAFYYYLAICKDDPEYVLGDEVDGNRTVHTLAKIFAKQFINTVVFHSLLMEELFDHSGRLLVSDCKDYTNKWNLRIFNPDLDISDIITKAPSLLGDRNYSN
jgi:hypothetical protein